jgi:pimeloyl-ACP methyl ester carboxylesterase
MIVRFFAAVLLGVSLGSSAFGAIASVDGIDVYWTSEGEGPAIIFVHGAFVNMATWERQLSAFADEYRVIALDLPGHGQSGTPPSGELSFDLFARAVEAVREAAGVERAVLVGHSMGTLVIKKYEILFPDRVAGLVTVDASLDLSRFLPLTPDLVPAAGNPPPPTETFCEQMYVPETPRDVKDQCIALAVAPYRDGVRELPNYRPAFARERDVEALGDQSIAAPPIVDAPVLEVYGGEDSQVVDPEAVLRVIPHARTEIIAGTGHLLNMEKPAEFNRVLRDFLEDIDF